MANAKKVNDAEPNTAETNNSQNVSVGKGKKGGYVFIAPAGTTLPEKFEDLSSDFVNLGYLSEDGIKEAIEIDSEDFVDLNGDNVLTSISKNKKTYNFSMIEVKKDVFKLLYGDSNVTEDTTDNVITAKDKAEEFVDKVMVIELLLTNGGKMRKVMPLAKITELGEVPYSSQDLIAFEATWTLSKDTNDVREYIYKK